jgi:hypothetical protein
VKHAAYGNVVVPRWSDKKDDFDFLTTPFVVTVSEIALLQPSETNIHYTKQYSSFEVEKIHLWFKKVGVELDYLEIGKERVPVLSSLLKRQRVNVWYFMEFLKQCSALPKKEEKINQRFF